MRLRSLTRRRPSASIIISCAALFLSLGGVGYAASGMIGTSQIKNNAVTFKKIAPNSVGRVRLANGGVINSKIARNAVTYKNIRPNSVGIKRANINQLQERVKGTCATGSAVASVDNKGSVTCNPTAPSEFASTASTTPTTLTGTAATAASVALPAGGTYLGFANTHLSATSGGAATRVTVSCTFTVGTATVSRTAVLRVDATKGDITTASLPLQLAGAAGTSSVACNAKVPTGAALPAVTATSVINALQTAANG